MGEIKHQVNNILVRSKYKKPEIWFDLSDTDWICYARFGRYWLTAEGRKKKESEDKVYNQIFEILSIRDEKWSSSKLFAPTCFWGCCLASGGDKDSNPSLPPQLEKVKKIKRGGKKSQERKYARFIKRVGEEVFVTCSKCGRKNFSKYRTCLVCATELPIKEDNKKSVYWDVERANGPWDADPINIGLIKMSDRDNTIVDRLEIFVWTEDKISWSQGHKITKNYRDKTMAKSGAAVNYLSQETSIQKLEEFIQDASYLICHDSVDYRTIDAMANRRNKAMPNFERIERRDSTQFFKFIMWNEYKSLKYGMKTIVTQFSDSQTEFESGAHGALNDAMALASICTCPKLRKRFADWKVLGSLRDLEDMKEFVKPSSSFLPG